VAKGRDTRVPTPSSMFKNKRCSRYVYVRSRVGIDINTNGVVDLYMWSLVYSDRRRIFGGVNRSLPPSFRTVAPKTESSSAPPFWCLSPPRMPCSLSVADDDEYLSTVCVVWCGVEVVGWVVGSGGGGS
jgi:hypothetical protein